MRRVAILVTLVVGARARVAHGDPAAVVPSGGDAVLTFDYAYELDTSTVAREHIGDPSQDPLSPIVARKDLVSHQFEHTLTPQLDVGIYHDTWLTIALPIVIAQSHELSLDSGVTRASSSTLADGYLPAAGYDATTNGGTPPGNDVFRGVTRHGIDQLHLGIGGALMNQARDPTKPTWKLGGELRLAVGSVMSIDPASPGSNTAVGRGVHEVRLWTSFDKKIGWAEPHVELFWQAPIGVTSSSPFQDLGFGSTNTLPGQQAGATFGFEAAAVDDKATQNHISLDLGSRIVAHFEGRDYSEMWEVFKLAGATPGPLSLDSDPTTPGTQALSNPGITNVENYLELAANAAVRAQIGKRVRIALTGEAIVKTDHAITFADAGVDFDHNNVVNPGTREVNPAYVPAIDLVGHRYISEHNLGVVLGLQAQFVF